MVIGAGAQGLIGSHRLRLAGSLSMWSSKASCEGRNEFGFSDHVMPLAIQGISVSSEVREEIGMLLCSEATSRLEVGLAAALLLLLRIRIAIDLEYWLLHRPAIITLQQQRQLLVLLGKPSLSC